MHRQPYTPLVVAIGVLCAMTWLVPMQAVGQTPRATVVTIEGATKTWRVTDMDGKVVEVEVPSHSPVDIRTSKEEQLRPGGTSPRVVGTVSATVVAVDTLTNHVKVRTQEGQIIELATPAKDIQIGEQLTLVVP